MIEVVNQFNFTKEKVYYATKSNHIIDSYSYGFLLL